MGMEATNNLFVTNRIKEMIRRYAAKPERFFMNGQINNIGLDMLIEKYVTISPGVRGGKACIKGTRIAVSDIIGDTWHFMNPKNYILKKMYAPRIPNEAIDAAYAFFIRFPQKIMEDYTECYNKPFPKELYK